MINPYEAIEKLIGQAYGVVELHNSQPHNANNQWTIRNTIEAQAAELILHYARIWKAGDGKVYMADEAGDAPPTGWRDIVNAYQKTFPPGVVREGYEDDAEESRRLFAAAAQCIGDDLLLLEERWRRQQAIKGEKS